jgi:hypothetical protein
VIDETSASIALGLLIALVIVTLEFDWVLRTAAKLAQWWLDHFDRHEEQR